MRTTTLTEAQAEALVAEAADAFFAADPVETFDRFDALITAALITDLGLTEEAALTLLAAWFPQYLVRIPADHDRY